MGLALQSRTKYDKDLDVRTESVTQLGDSMLTDYLGTSQKVTSELVLGLVSDILKNRL